MPAKCWREAIQGPSSDHFFLSAPDDPLDGVAVALDWLVVAGWVALGEAKRKDSIAAKRLPTAAPAKPARWINVIARPLALPAGKGQR